MRKRAELRAATTNLQKPWEKSAKAPTLFVVTADKHLQALADRFQKLGGIDLWTEKDEPESLAFDGKLSVRSATLYTRVNSIDGDDARSSRSQQVAGQWINFGQAKFQIISVLGKMLCVSSSACCGPLHVGCASAQPQKKIGGLGRNHMNQILAMSDQKSESPSHQTAQTPKLEPFSRDKITKGVREPRLLKKAEKAIME